MTKSKLRKIAIVFSSLAVLSGGLGIDTAYARGGGGFGGGGFGGGHIGGGHIGGFGGGHIRSFGGDHIGGEFGGGHFSGGLSGDHMTGGLGGIPTDGIGGGHIGGEFRGGLTAGGGIANMEGDSPVGTEHVGAPTDNHVGALAGVHPGPTVLRSRDHRR